MQATVKHGIDTILPNTTIQLQPMIRVDDPAASEPYVPTDLIKVPSSVKTDEKGHFSIPLEFVGDPCDYMDKSFVIKVSVDGFETEQQDYIYVSLRCVENMEFKINSRWYSCRSSTGPVSRGTHTAGICQGDRGACLYCRGWRFYAAG